MRPCPPRLLLYDPYAEHSLPYEGAKGMLHVDNVDDKGHLTGSFEAMYDDRARRMIGIVGTDFHMPKRAGAKVRFCPH